LAVVAAAAKVAAEGDEHARVARATACGLAVGGRCVGEPAGALERDGEPLVRARVGGRGADRLAKRRRRIVELSLVEERRPERRRRGAAAGAARAPASRARADRRGAARGRRAWPPRRPPNLAGARAPRRG